jgi:ornithine decarboxylase
VALPAVELAARPHYLPATLEAGDRLYVGSAGAYTLSYASHFNGFPPPTPVFISGARA